MEESRERDRDRDRDREREKMTKICRNEERRGTERETENVKTNNCM